MKKYRIIYSKNKYYYPQERQGWQWLFLDSAIGVTVRFDTEKEARRYLYLTRHEEKKKPIYFDERGNEIGGKPLIGNPPFGYVEEIKGNDN